MATLAACPACVAAPDADTIAREALAAVNAKLLLSVPGAHCAACISTLEKGLEKVPGVRSARVNLTLKRISIEAASDITIAELISEVAALGYDAHELDAGMLSATDTDSAGRELLMRLAVAGFAMMNVMLLSVAVWSGAEDATRDLFHWISAGIALPAVAFSGQPFFRSAWGALRVRRVNMDVPISLAILLASGTSLYETIHSGEHAYFDAAVSLTFFLLIGRYLDHRTRATARSAAQELAALEVPRALRLDKTGETVVSVADLCAGDVIRVLPGARIPADGTVETGESEIDRSLLTGETLPLFAGPGAQLAAGEVNLTGPLTLRVTAAGKDTALHRIADLVAVAEAGRGRFRSLSDKAVRFYTPFVHTTAFLSFLGWLWATGDMRHAINIAAAVLIITCPCALGLAVPAVMTTASGRLFKHGLLIKDGTALERLAEVDTVVFDKTGTLTLGKPELTNLKAVPKSTVEVAAALANGSAHPLAIALAEAAKTADIKPAKLENIKEVPGHGIEAYLKGTMVRLGRADWVGGQVSQNTATWLKMGDAAPVEFTFTDRLRPGVKTMLDQLSKNGLSIHLLSGDTEAPVRALADKLGIHDWKAGVLPEEKASYVKAMAKNDTKVLMVGDGLNDTAALAGAHVSISPASALDAARVASDVVLLGQNLSPISEAITVSKRSVRLMLGNILISNVYNLIAVPVAIAGFATPLAAALAMSTSSISVTLNALRLRK